MLIEHRRIIKSLSLVIKLIYGFNTIDPIIKVSEKINNINDNDNKPSWKSL
ncbi:MAG: hypothetical protein ACFFCV_08725 [Promethearchaeota archaeon]